MKMLLLLLTLFATGCATDTHWTKAGGTLDEFNRDSYDCAARSSAREDSFSGFGRGSYSGGVRVNKDLYRLCMASRGYERSDAGAWVGVRD